ncbi:unnamed protein product [Cuscuta campestris]|uniref:Terpene synthase N-terminal domain-containing protein n=1 Tax=Cuscuta campestris TaxID=132261 RepID=A0A484MBQ3_9ASTE|nr:unnamed protein product [Cuscuta campestris]
MSSSSSFSSPLRHYCCSSSPRSPLPKLYLINGDQQGFTPRLQQHCKAIRKPRTQEVVVLQNGLTAGGGGRGRLEVDELPRLQEEDHGSFLENHTHHHEAAMKEIKGRVEVVRSKLRTMGDGEITVSAYDTAWVALVKDDVVAGGRGDRPQFPSALEWIAGNQLADGSWGDGDIFLAHDRVLNTLACVIALKSWNVCPLHVQKGMMFLRENMRKVEEEDGEHMPIGFEVAFPSLMAMAKKLGIHLPHHDHDHDHHHDSRPLFQNIYAHRKLKLTKIPKEVMHQVPTTLLHSLEGMEGVVEIDLDWEKLLPLQCHDGSFLFSPASTAFALIHTKDPNCLRYLSNAVRQFHGGVPNVYPVDLFERIWVVDRLQRLGISRFFKPEIADCIAYVQRYWSDERGICWARNTRVEDIDDTAMAFRLLRLHGYPVSPEVFKNFKKGREFVCFAGQTNQAVTGMYNLYRASQVRFPGEEILEDAMEFSSLFLQHKRASNQLLDKWIITKDLPGEVGYALDLPWYASLPRLETRFFLEQYGGEEDVWIGKTLYRMPLVSNNLYLELGKLDYNNCQAVHQQEWKSIQKWSEDCKLGVSKRSLLLGFYLAMASIFEPERSKERLAWAKTAALAAAIRAEFCLDHHHHHKRAFTREFTNATSRASSRHTTREQTLVGALNETLNQLSRDALLTHGRDVRPYLRRAWEKWLLAWEKDDGEGEAELVVRTLNAFNGQGTLEELWFSHPRYQQLMEITNRVCHGLSLYRHAQSYEREADERPQERMTKAEVEREMQSLVKIVLTDDDDEEEEEEEEEDLISPEVKQTFLTVTKAFYYAAFCNPGTIDSHIAKVLFQRVL